MTIAAHGFSRVHDGGWVWAIWLGEKCKQTTRLSGEQQDTPAALARSLPVREIVNSSAFLILSVTRRSHWYRLRRLAAVSSRFDQAARLGPKFNGCMQGASAASARTKQAGAEKESSNASASSSHPSIPDRATSRSGPTHKGSAHRRARPEPSPPLIASLPPPSLPPARSISAAAVATVVVYHAHSCLILLHPPRLTSPIATGHAVHLPTAFSAVATSPQHLPSPRSQP